MANSTSSDIKATRPIPHKKGWPLLGELPALLGLNPFTHLKDVMLKYGDLVQLDMSVQPIYLVSHPDYVQQIMRDKASNYPKPEGLVKPIRELLGNGLLTNSGDSWLRQRRMIQPHLHRKQLTQIFNEMVNAITTTLEPWAEWAETSTPVNFGIEVSKITISVILQTMFGQGILSPTDSPTITQIINRLLDYIGRTFYTSSLPTWLIPGRQQFQEDIQKLSIIVHHIIAQCEQQRDTSASLVQMLLSAVDEETNIHMTAQQLYDEVITIFIAGYETTATALTWLGVVLEQNPEVAAKLQAEVKQVLGSRTPTFEDLTQLTYTRHVFMEILRMYTVIPMLPRSALAADKIGPYAIPAGALMFVFFHGVHHNPNFWEHPEKFNPERFTPQRLASQHPFAYLPFSAGPRKCAGEDFALLEGPLIIAMILQRYTLRTLPNQNYATRLASTLRPDQGVKVTLSKISS